MTIRLYDSGLQPERTLLAWRRTCLSLGLGIAAGIRYSAGWDALVVMLLGVLALAVVFVAYVLTAVRYRNVSTTLTSGEPHLASGGKAITMLALVAGIVALVAVHFVILRAS